MASLSTDGMPPESVESYSIVSYLRSMRSAALAFHEESRDILPEILKGVNIVEYLKPYIEDNYADKWSNNGPYIFLISGDHWWVGYNIGNEKYIRNSETKGVKKKLVQCNI